MRKYIFLLVINFLIVSFVNIFAIDYERFVLDNGLEVYAIQDNFSPNANVFYINEAGFANQSIENTGYFELYTKIFWQTNPDFEKNSQKILISNTESSIMNHQAVYNFSVPSDFLETSLEYLSFQLKNPSFQNEVIKNVYELTVNNESRNLATTAVVEETLTKGLIKETLKSQLKLYRIL